MEIKRGIPVSSGVAIGEAFVIDRQDYKIIKRFINEGGSAVSEKKRYQDAVKKAVEELKKIEISTKNMRDISIIFMGHRAIIEDAELQKEILDEIDHSLVTAEYAVSYIMSKHRQTLESFHSEYYSRRASDLEDIEKRMVDALHGEKREEFETLQKPVIIIAHELTPSETAILPQNKTLAFLTDTGGRTSHAAIVARTRGIPAVVGLGSISTKICRGDTLIVDGQKGIVIIQPDEAILNSYLEIQQQEKVHKNGLKTLINLPIETIDGYDITLRANIEDPSEVKIAMDNGAMGIGLYRTEFIYVNNQNPQEEDHFQAYQDAVQHLGKNKLVIRTLDFGADKNFGIKEFEEFQEERNPFLGCRSIRLCFEKIPVFKKQLRAILRASVLGDIDIMFPMISSLEEVRQAKSILEESKEELKREKIPYNDQIKVGIMVEIPSTAIIADLLAKEVDFFSIGSNDLIQYSLAVDRINARVAYLYKPAHPAIFRMIRHIIDVARENRIKVSICGEMSAEFVYLIPLMGLGMRDFSLSPGIIPEGKEFIRSLTMRRVTKITEHIMSCRTHQEAIDYLTKEIPNLQIHSASN